MNGQERERGLSERGVKKSRQEKIRLRGARSILEVEKGKNRIMVKKLKWAREDKNVREGE